MTANYYQVLGVDATATPVEIKLAYRHKCKTCHPDRGGSDEAMAEVNQAYACLSNEDLRLSYDTTGVDPRREPTREDAAQSLLRQMFTQAIDEIDGDCVQWVRDRLSGLKTNAITRRADLNKRETRLNRQRKRITRKGQGENLAHQIIDMQLAQITADRQQADDIEELAGVATKMLADYECEPAPEPAPLNRMTGAEAMAAIFGANMTNGPSVGSFGASGRRPW
jgi:curved DNA-binding protein CbpA